MFYGCSSYVVQPKVWIAYSNHAAADVFLHEEIEKASASLAACNVLYALSRPGPTSATTATTPASQVTTPSSGDAEENDPTAVIAHVSSDGETKEEGNSMAGGVLLASKPFTSEGRKVVEGRLTKDSLAAFLPAPTVDTCVLACGPPSFLTATDKALRDMYYLAPNIFLAD